MRTKPGLILIIFFLLMTLSKASFSQTNDTIVDSHDSWTKLQEKFVRHYDDSIQYSLTGYQKQKAIQLINTQLSLVDVVYIGYDNRIHKGQIICHRSIENDIKEIFSELLQMRFPIYECKPISEFEFTDVKSMQANNTNSFDYRLKTGSRAISEHSYGLAIDINPVENPYKKGTEILPDNNTENINTGRIRITDEMGRRVITLFGKHGWVWGGSWRSLKDYMHFEKR